MQKSTRVLILLSIAALEACATSKSSNPLSPTVAGPIGGVSISAPRLLEPTPGAQVNSTTQPLTLMIENATTSGVRPLSYTFEVAADAGFANNVFVRDGVSQGDNGQTSLRLPGALASGRTYYWRAHAADGANTGPPADPASFNVFTPVVIGAPVLVAPVDNVLTSDNSPRFTIGNAPRSGPVGPIAYVIEIANSDSFANKLAIWTVSEQPNQTSLDAPANLPFESRWFWHVLAYDSTTVGPWSRTQVFRTPAAPASPPTGPSPGGPGSGHVPPGPLTADRAQQVVFATAAEFPRLTAVFPTDQQASNAATELLLRMIWHLHLAGYQAGRQRNPSGLISGDKLTILINGGWHAYDVMSLGFAGRATTVQFLEIGSPVYVPEPGIPD